MKTLLSGLTRKNIFSRGLPKEDTLQVPEINAVFKTFLKTEDPIELNSASQIPGLESCVKHGWIYETASEIFPTKSTQYYMFASLLHRRYLNYLVFPSKTELEDDDILKFIIKVIHLMSESTASTAQRHQLGSFIQSIPEAKFQKDFYAACCEYDKSLVSFPEFGTKDGRIDFFIHCKKWGIELLRNGDRLAPHVRRFTQGEYGEWLKSGYMEDYITLDFRSTKLPNADDHGGASGRFPPPSSIVTVWLINFFFSP